MPHTGGRDQRQGGVAYNRLRVTSVQRVENMLLWNRYKATMFALQAAREVGNTHATPAQMIEPLTANHSFLGPVLCARSEKLRPQVCHAG